MSVEPSRIVLPPLSHGCRLREELKRLQREVGFTAIFVTHDQEEALLLGDRIAIMQGGRFERIFRHKPQLAWAIHPQAIAISAPGTPALPADGAYSTAATIAAVTVLSAVIRYAADTGGGVLKIDTLNRLNTPVLRTGDVAQLSISPADVRELPEG